MYRKILVPYDLSELGREALYLALRHLKSNPDNELLVVHAVSHIPVYSMGEEPSSMFYPEETLDSIKTHIRNQLHSFEFSSNLLTQTEIIVEWGDPASVVLGHQDKTDAIVLTTHGHSGLKKLLLGGVTEKIIRGSHKPVLVVRTATSWPPQRIVVPVTFEPQAHEFLRQLVALFPEQTTEYHLVHVLSEPDLLGIYKDILNNPLGVNIEMMTQKAAQSLELLGKSVFQAQPIVSVVTGDVCESIRNYAHDVGASLVAVATHHKSGLKHLLLGSSVDKLVRQLECNVLCDEV